MVIDTSAVMAVLKREPDAQAIAEVMAQAEVRLMSAATLVEAGLVALSDRGAVGSDDLDRFLLDAGIDIVPVTEAHARLAREGFARFGKGRHPARLNFGDCFSYALAKASGHPLLFKGNDFSQTDVDVVGLTEA
jgi:ribonuclease VapC